MPNFKKLIFAPLFLLSQAAVFYQLNPFLRSSDLIFSLSLDTFIKLILICLAVLLSGIFFIIFAALANTWKLIIPSMLVSSLIPFIFLSPSLAVVSAVLMGVSLLISFIGLENKMKNYLTFQPTTLFIPSIKQLAGLLIISLSLTYYLSINSEISKNGFQIPDSLIDTALKLTPQAPQELNVQGNLNDLLKKTVKDQFQTMLKPYQSFIAPILALLFFFSLQAFVAIISIFLSPLIWFIFYILEKTKFITFTTEMREVKKMIV